MTGLSEYTGLDFLRFLETHAVHVRDQSELRTKILEISSDGPQNFQVISDFDRTLTPQWLKDPCSISGVLRGCQSSHGVIESSSLVSVAYAKHTKELASHYIPLEHDIHLSRELKTKICEEWYQKAHECMLAENLSQSLIDKIVSKCWSDLEIHLRENTQHFFESCARNEVPVTVLSAGLADVISRILELESIHGSGDVMVVGNRMTFGDDGQHIGFSDRVIHTLNKRNALSESILNSEGRCQRKNALVMGDLIGDVDFVHSVPHLSQYIAIAFLADGPDHEVRLKEYLKHFDIVVTGGSASMDVPAELLKTLF